jgi:hypothetical protein
MLKNRPCSQLQGDSAMHPIFFQQGCRVFWDQCGMRNFPELCQLISILNFSKFPFSNKTKSYLGKSPTFRFFLINDLFSSKNALPYKELSMLKLDCPYRFFLRRTLGDTKKLTTITSTLWYHQLVISPLFFISKITFQNNILLLQQVSNNNQRGTFFANFYPNTRHSNFN